MVSELQKSVLCGSGKKNIQMGLMRDFFGLKFILHILGWPEQPIQFFGVFSLPAPTLVMTKGLKHFASPKMLEIMIFSCTQKKGQI